MTYEVNGISLRTITDPHKEIKNYTAALAAFDAAENTLKAARKNCTAKNTIVSDLEDEYAGLIQKTRRGEEVDPTAAYRTKNAIPVARADADLSAEGIVAAQERLVAARDYIHHVLREALKPYLAQLQADAAEADRKLASAKTEAWEKEQYAMRLFNTLWMDQRGLTIDVCKQFLGIA